MKWKLFLFMVTLISMSSRSNSSSVFSCSCSICSLIIIATPPPFDVLSFLMILYWFMLIWSSSVSFVSFILTMWMLLRLMNSYIGLCWFGLVLWVLFRLYLLCGCCYVWWIVLILRLFVIVCLLSLHSNACI